MRKFHPITIAVLMLIAMISVMRYVYRHNIEEVCVPAHINLDCSKYIVIRTDTVKTDNTFPIKKIYYRERNRK